MPLIKDILVKPTFFFFFGWETSEGNVGSKIDYSKHRESISMPYY